MKNIYVFVSQTNGQVTFEESEIPLSHDDVYEKAYTRQSSCLIYALHLESESDITMRHMKLSKTGVELGEKT
jgi:hypothetical protein